MEHFYKMGLSVSNLHMQINLKILQLSIDLISKEVFDYLAVTKPLRKPFYLNIDTWAQLLGLQYNFSTIVNFLGICQPIFLSSCSITKILSSLQICMLKSPQNTLARYSNLNSYVKE